MNVIREGPLAIKSTGKQPWTDKYVLLSECCLTLGKKHEDCTKGKHCKQFRKHDCYEVTKEDSEDGKYCFSIRTKINLDDKEKILLAATSDDDREEWMRCIKTFSAHYSDEKLEIQDEDQRSRSETSGTRDSGYNSRSSQLLELPRTSTDTASIVRLGEQEEEDSRVPTTNSEMGKLAHDPSQEDPDFSSNRFRQRARVVTKRSSIICPHCRGEIDLNPRALCSESTNKPTEHDSRTEGQSNTPSEHAENTD